MNLDLPVYSFFENYVLTLGWIVNNAVWDTMNETMIAAIPFLALIAREWYQARREGEDEGNKGLLSLNRIEASLYAMILIYVFAAVPMMGVQFAPAQIDQSHDSQCDVAVISGTESAAGGGSSLGGKTASMPLWWATVHAVSTGLTNAMIGALPCQPDFKYLQTKLDTTQIQDPELGQELSRFHTACFGQARYQLFRKENAVDDKRSRDTDWLGSTYFLNTPGYYDSMQAQNPVPGFAYNDRRDSGRGTTPDQGGYPTCKQWWSAGGHGLKARLHDQLNQGFWNRLRNIYNSVSTVGGGSPEDQAIRHLLKHQQARGNGGDATTAMGGNFADKVLGNVAGLFGVGLSTIPAKGMEAVSANAMPKIQYLIMMAIVIVTPFVVVFSGYSFKAVGLVTFGYLGATTLTFWFQLSRWLQNHLIDALYHSDKLGNMASMYDQGVLGLVNAVMLFLFPPIWMGMLGWAGYSVGASVSNAMSKGGNEASSAGKKGGEKGQSAASGGKL